MVMFARRSSTGFTLIELLVAMAVFAVLASITYGALTTVLTARSETETRNARRAAVMHAVTILERDVLQMVSRPIRDEFDRQRPALVIERVPAPGMELTRTGLPNPRQEKRAALQRVAYAVDGTTLVRRVWSVLDRTAQTTPLTEDLLDDVDNVQFEALQQEWSETWPPLGQDPDSILDVMPRAVRIRLQLRDVGELVRELPVASGFRAQG